MCSIFPSPISLALGKCKSTFFFLPDKSCARFVGMSWLPSLDPRAVSLRSHSSQRSTLSHVIHVRVGCDCEWEGENTRSPAKTAPQFVDLAENTRGVFPLVFLSLNLLWFLPHEQHLSFEMCGCRFQNIVAVIAVSRMIS